MIPNDNSKARAVNILNRINKILCAICPEMVLKMNLWDVAQRFGGLWRGYFNYDVGS